MDAATRVFAMACGWLTGDLGGFLVGETGRLKVPVPAFLIDHPKGKVLFDTGLNAQTQTDPEARLGRWMADRFEVDFEPGQEIGARLRALEVDPADIDFVVLSHLHFDHAGGLDEIPNATLVVQTPEWEAGREPDVARRNGFASRDYDLGHRLLTVGGEHDLFGDGRVVCLPTYGHTPGHQSLRVRTDDADLVLTADACYLRRTLEEMRLPSVVSDPEVMRESLVRLARLRDAGARVVFGHDPEQWKSIPQPPAAL